MRKFILIALLLALPTLASAQGIQQLQQWKTGGTNIIQPTNSSAGLLVPGLATSTTGILCVLSGGWVTPVGCSNALFGKSWEINAQGYLAPTTTITTLHPNGLISAASSTIGNGTQTGGLTISGGATTTENAYFASQVGIGTSTPSSNFKAVVDGNVWITGVNGRGNNNATVIGKAFVGTTGAEGVQNDVLNVGTSSVVANVRAGTFSAYYNGAGSSQGGIAQGINGNAIMGASTTGNLTSVTANGGPIRNRYQAVNNSVGYNLALSSALSGLCTVNGTLASSTDCASFHAELPTIGAGNLMTNNYGLWVRGGTPTGTLTNRYGVYIDDLIGGTNRYGIYQAGATDLNYFAGNTTFAGNLVSDDVTSNGSLNLDAASGNSIYLQVANGGEGQVELSQSNFIFYPTGTTAVLQADPNGLTVTGQSTTTGTGYFGGKVGIGTTSPYAMLSVATPPGATGSLSNLFVIASSTPTATTTLFAIDNTGNVGINNVQNLTSNAVARLVINDAGSMGRIWFPRNNTSNTGMLLGNVSAGAGVNGFIHMLDAAGLQFGTSNTARMNITSGGNVGIGTTTPDQKLNVNGDIRVEGGDIYGGHNGAADQTLNLRGNDDVNIHLDDDAATANNSGDFHIYDGADNTLVTLLETGNFGIGTTTPYAKLSIHANNGNTNKTLFAVASSTATATTTLFNINNTGVITSTAAGTSTFSNTIQSTCFTTNGTTCITGGGAASSANYRNTGTTKAQNPPIAIVAGDVVKMWFMATLSSGCSSANDIVMGMGYKLGTFAATTTDATPGQGATGGDRCSVSGFTMFTATTTDTIAPTIYDAASDIGADFTSVMTTVN